MKNENKDQEFKKPVGTMDFDDGFPKTSLGNWLWLIL